jgi:hypothetical protein
MIKFALYFALAGFFIPFIFTILWIFLENYSKIYNSIGEKLELIQLLLWPPSIFMMATANHEIIDFNMMLISTIANTIIYTGLGLLLWWGLNRNKFFLLVPCAALLFGWYLLFKL